MIDLNNKNKKFIYAISNGNNIKIGISNNPKRRLKQLNTGSDKNLYLLGYFEGDLELEKWIHNNFVKVRFNSEWMIASQELLEYLNSVMKDSFVDWLDGNLVRYMKIKK